jgi:hypothetical protein
MDTTSTVGGHSRRRTRCDCLRQQQGGKGPCQDHWDEDRSPEEKEEAPHLRVDSSELERDVM